jgi:ubiquinone/menaquinone biosynthesis C-methylase UbiE
LKRNIADSDKIILDFGCGVGRFSEKLSQLANGRTIGVDPIKELLDLAKASDSVDYKQIIDGRIPIPDDCIDILWICLVLGGIKEDYLREVCLPEIKRVLKPDSLVCLIENTAESPSGQYWYFRNTNWYAELFSEYNLIHVDSYKDLDQDISILIGRGGS